VDQLHEFNGCCVSTAEIIWKHDRALSASHSKMHRRDLSKTIKAAMLIPTTRCCYTNDNDNSNDSVSLLSVIRSELTDENIDSFLNLVEDIYKQSFELQYKGFTVLNDYFVERKDVKIMYELLVDLFPFVHLVLALTASHSRYGAVKLSLLLSLEDDLESDSDSDSEDDNTLTKRQHAIIEFFIAKLHLCSQKNMRHWELVMPLTCHSHSHGASPPSHPLHGASWSWNVLWNTLNEVFDRLVPARHDNVCQQYTVSMAFDNWQQMLKNTWQTNGYSSNYLMGVASFIRRTRQL